MLSPKRATELAVNKTAEMGTVNKTVPARHVTPSFVSPFKRFGSTCFTRPLSCKQVLFLSLNETNRGAFVLKSPINAQSTLHVQRNETHSMPIIVESLKQTLAGKGGACSSMALAKPKEVSAPPKAGAYEAKKESPPTEFRRFYTRGDLPLQVGYAPVYIPCLEP
jgi:hypothetical protein